MMHLKRLIIMAVFLVLHPPNARADLLPANGAETAANFAEISVLEDRARVTLEIDLGDVHGFLANAAEGDDPAGNLSERTGKAFEVFADGVALVPETVQLDVRNRKPRVTAFRPSYGLAPQDERSSQVIYVVLDYPFDHKPTEITFTPPLTSDGVPTVAIGVIFDHLGVAVTDYRYLSRPEVFYPNWNDPWYSRFENPNLTRHHKSALMSFVSVEPREVRHEVIFRLRDLEGWLDLKLGEGTVLSADVMAMVKQQAIDLFSHSNPLTIDGQEILPSSAKVEQLSVGVDGLKVLANPSETNRATAILGIVLSYPRNALPREFSLNWDLFTEETGTIPVQITDLAGAVPGQVTRDAPEITWKNYILQWNAPRTQPVTVATMRSISVPVLSLGLVFIGVCLAAFAWRNRPGHWQGWAVIALSICLVAGVLRTMTVEMTLPTKALRDTTAAAQVTEAIVSNLAIARLETQDLQFSKALRAFVRAETLQDVAAEIRRGLSVTLPSGATARIESTDALVVESIEPKADGGNRILARWDALVSGGHWGHMHRRIVSYRALIDVDRDADAWVLSGLTILETRMNSQPVPEGGNS
ncbi:hypothetical protein RUE5091_03187 [Ruegeria denitrificans]|uniref:Protein BatD n=1 Tax=Ruegeria denitrificans TaxID=1715692 RepID=A0A0P1IF62_9RHOB|nr:hypothetical protein [Ruegeria denitrificans]CUK09509.1 hypothetical protein RUE5091_03187 [Ruegeria denitrificans]